MKVRKSILESIIKRTMLEMSEFEEITTLEDEKQEEQEAYESAFLILKVVFGEYRFDKILSNLGGKLLQGIMLKFMSGKNALDVQAMSKMSASIIASSSFHEKCSQYAKQLIRKAISEKPQLEDGEAVAAASVDKLVRAIFSLDIASESLFAFFYRFYPSNIGTQDFPGDAMEAVFDWGPENPISFTQADIDFVSSPEGLKGLARKVFDEVTKFYRHHDQHDDLKYKEYGLSFSEDFMDEEIFTTGWRDPNLNL